MNRQPRRYPGAQDDDEQAIAVLRAAGLLMVPEEYPRWPCAAYRSPARRTLDAYSARNATFPDH